MKKNAISYTAKKWARKDRSGPEAAASSTEKLHKPRSSVKVASNESIKAVVRVRPRLQIPAAVCPPAAGGTAAAMFVAPASAVEGYLAAPVASPAPNTKLKQVTGAGWDRLLHSDDRPAPNPIPVILSAQTNWVLADDVVEVFGTAHVIDGASQLEANLRSDPSRPMMFVVFFGLSEQQELALRNELSQNATTELVSVQKVDTDAPRLAITGEWTQLTIESDPFVLPTFRGYAPAIMVRREESDLPEHLLVGAKSLAEPLEELRRKLGSLNGVVVSIRKSDPSVKTSPYEVNTES